MRLPLSATIKFEPIGKLLLLVQTNWPVDESKAQGCPSESVRVALEMQYWPREKSPLIMFSPSVCSLTVPFTGPCATREKQHLAASSRRRAAAEAVRLIARRQASDFMAGAKKCIGVD